MLDLGFDRIDAVNGESGFGLDFRRRIFGNDALFGERFRHSQFDVEPALVFVLVFPDLAHLWARISWYHAASPLENGSTKPVAALGVLHARAKTNRTRSAATGF